jgi:serine/threonine-protein kinase
MVTAAAPTPLATPTTTPDTNVAATTPQVAEPVPATTPATAPAAAVPSPKAPHTPVVAALQAPAGTVKPAAATTTTPPRESAKDRKAREGREREARENDARVAAAAKLVAPLTGTVRIAISPWGLVEVDGAPSGAAPPITELTLAEGRHQIVVRNGDFAPYSASITVTAGQTVSLRYKFGS